MINEQKLCPGVIGTQCPRAEMIGARKEVCGACYARRLYHQRKTKVAAKKAVHRKAIADDTPASYGGGAVDLAALKAKLLAQLAAIDLVGKLAIEPE